MPQKDYIKIMEEKNKQKELVKQLNKTSNIIRTIKDRKRVEMEYLGAVKRQMGYWKSQLNNTDPKKDKERYDQLKNNIEREKAHINLIEEELDRINEEIKRAQEHKSQTRH